MGIRLLDNSRQKKIETVEKNETKIYLRNELDGGIAKYGRKWKERLKRIAKMLKTTNQDMAKETFDVR